MITLHITPDPHCRYCHGSGIVYDTVDYGSTTAQMPSDCDCVTEQIPDELVDVEVQIVRDAPLKDCPLPDGGTCQNAELLDVYRKQAMDMTGERNALRAKLDRIASLALPYNRDSSVDVHRLSQIRDVLRDVE